MPNMPNASQLDIPSSISPEIAPLTINASIADRITFASHQNDVAIIADLIIQNNTAEPYENLELTLTCEPELVGKKSWKIDRIMPHSEVRIRDRKIPLSGSMLSELNERIRGTLKLTIVQNGKTLQSLEQSIVGLAKNEWGGASHMPELLGAFSMPNDPAVTTILKQAGEALRKAGERPSLDGYQSKSRSRVWQITSAIWTAISSQRLVYAEPPASFETEGQKIRTPGEVLEGGIATCLDTTLLFSAALEQAGLYPVIAFTKGHAFCGVWLQPQQLPSLTVDDCVDIRKYIALKELVLFETTLVTNEPPLSFSKAVEVATQQISEENEDKFVYALDIKQARRHQITPLNTSISKIASNEVLEAEPVTLGLEIAPELPAFDIGVDESSAPDTPETRLDHWKRKLLDLTKRNRLLNLKPSKTAIKLYCPDPATLEDKLAENKKITVIPLAKLPGDAGTRDEDLFQGRTGEDFKKRFAQEALDRNEIVADMAQIDLDAGLVQLYRKAKNDLQEGGANTLYLALGMLRWKQAEHETRIYRAPLLLVPVKLERQSAASKVKIVHHEDEPVFNMTLLEMLRQDFDLHIPLLEGELPKDDSGVDVPLIWEIMRKAIREIPGFEVSEDVVLSTFSFAKYLMWKDLAERTDALKQSPFVKHLIESPRDAYEHSSNFIKPSEIDEKIDPKDLFMPLPADGSQIVAVHASTQGGDFILEGPPGTGKSQTISNIIAHNLALGKKVLFVSEKMAALEVVYNRLKDKGLGKYCLELHSNKANKREVLNQLGASWHSREIKAQDEWHMHAQRLKDLRDNLNNFVKILHTPHKTGVSVRMAIGQAVRWQENYRLKLDWGNNLSNDRLKDRGDLEQARDIAKRLGQNYAVLNEDDVKAFSDIQQTNWSNAWQNDLVDAASNIVKSANHLSLATQKILVSISIEEKSDLTLGFCNQLKKIATAIKKATSYNLGFALQSEGQEIFDALERLYDLLEAYRTAKAELPYIDDNVKSAPISLWKAEWSEAENNLWPLNKAKLFLLRRKMNKFLYPHADSNAEVNLDVVDKLHSYLVSIDKLASKIPMSAPWDGLSTDIANSREILEIGKGLREGIAGISSSVEEFPRIRERICAFCVDGRDMLQAGMPIPALATEFIDSLERFEGFYKNYEHLCDAKELGGDNLAVITNKAEGIVNLQTRINAWCRWQNTTKEARSYEIFPLVSAIINGTVLPENAEDAFYTAYCSWLSERLIDDRDVLREFSAVSHEDKIILYRQIDKKLSELSIEYIKAKLSGDIPDPEDVTRASGYGILNRELQKKMRHKPVRQLITEMGDALTALTPCLLMSPLSVAQFLSTDSQMFDLVVFDEASQITVWDAIGAIARGKNVIVVGDPKQMPPTSFFDRSASSEEETDDDIEDLESILDEALAASVKLHRLTGHYRSKHESLIAFSNHRYYNGELVTYPAAETRETAVSLIKVEGEYLRGKGRTNPEEAKAIVREVIGRLTDPVRSQLSIGVIALNSEQQRLIDDLLDQERRNNPELEKFFGDDVEEPVFVKNLETVQGDQRDVILLSIGYGPDTPGAQTMSMNFGPLNRKGGERRLNVAITRATSEMVIFASFSPSMIDLTRTSAQAVRDLKHYLEFAERGPVALGEAITHIGGHDSYDSDFEEAVADGLRKYGWVIHTQIGVSKFRIDLGVMHPDNPGCYLAGIECDGMTYHSSPSARDRDKVRHAILENLNWRLIRIWSTDYFIDPKHTLERVNEQLNKILTSDREHNSKIPPCAKNDAVIEVDEIEDDQIGTAVLKSSNVVELSVAKTSDEAELQLSADQFYEPSYKDTIKGLAENIIDDIGPVTFKHLTDKIARAHGFRRTGTQIKKVVWASILKSRKYNKTDDGHTVLWPESADPCEVMNFRGLDINGHVREWADVPYPEKLGLAQKIKGLGNIEDPAAMMANEIGLGRLHQSTRAELENLICFVR